jgi:hypothetical protein
VLRAAVILAAIAIATPAAACPETTIRGRLEREARRAHRWDLAWGLTFGAAAGAYWTMAATDWEFGATLGHAQRDDLWISAGKTTIAGLSHIVLPLRIEEAPARDDGCSDDAAALHALAVSAHHETITLWLSIAGGIALNGAGLLYLGVHDHDWKQGLIDAGIGTPVAILHAWTVPRGARREAAALQVDVAIRPGFTGVVIGGTF